MDRNLMRLCIVF